MKHWHMKYILGLFIKLRYILGVVFYFSNRKSLLWIWFPSDIYLFCSNSIHIYHLFLNKMNINKTIFSYVLSNGSQLYKIKSVRNKNVDSLEQENLR